MCPIGLQATFRGLAMWWHLKNVGPKLLLNKYKKVKVNNQKFNRVVSAETEADSDLKVEATNVQPPYRQTVC
jgi:hypothetical protein